MAPRFLKIYGDNILECEKALQLVRASLSLGPTSRLEGPIWAPTHLFETGARVTLYPGHDRWGTKHFQDLGQQSATVREAVDALIVDAGRFEKPSDVEIPLLGIEFCSALPAGNQAWQRQGRSWALAEAGIPYLFVAEIGGQELDPESGEAKASRYPSPLVPISLLCADNDNPNFCLPIYLSSATADDDLSKTIDTNASEAVLLALARAALLREDATKARRDARDLALGVISFLTNERTRDDTMANTEVKSFCSGTPANRLAAIEASKGAWAKKVAKKTSSERLRRVLAAISPLCVSIGASDFPVAFVPHQNVGLVNALLKQNYTGRELGPLAGWIGTQNRGFLISFVCGFKPEGEDARPDRGLLPTARMLFPRDVIPCLTVIYGPAPDYSVPLLQTDQEKLARTNGLWESVLTGSNFVLLENDKFTGLAQKAWPVTGSLRKRTRVVGFPATGLTPIPGEQDVDTILHLLVSAASDLAHEVMFNPPGGDWSGANLRAGVELKRWSSLPRVSPTGQKRPDLVVQAKPFTVTKILSIESKKGSGDLEVGIGPRLAGYCKEQFAKPPTAVRNAQGRWRQTLGAAGQKVDEGYSGGAFLWSGESAARVAISKGLVDVALGVDLDLKEGKATVHVIGNRNAAEFTALMTVLGTRIEPWVKIEVH